MKNKTIITLAIILPIIFILFVEGLLFYESNQYVDLKQVVLREYVLAGEQVTEEKLMIDNPKPVLKENASDYITSENYKETFKNQCYFNKFMEKGDPIRFSDLIQ